MAQKDRPDRTLYSLTPAGAERLRGWIVAPPKASAIKIEAALKAHGFWLADRAALETVLNAYRTSVRGEIRELRRRWQEFQRERSAVNSTGEVRRQALSTFAAFRLSLAMRSAQLDWCDWLTESLDDPADQARPGGLSDR